MKFVGKKKFKIKFKWSIRIWVEGLHSFLLSSSSPSIKIKLEVRFENPSGIYCHVNYKHLLTLRYTIRVISRHVNSLNLATFLNVKKKFFQIANKISSRYLYCDNPSETQFLYSITLLVGRLRRRQKIIPTFWINFT